MRLMFLTAMWKIFKPGTPATFDCSGLEVSVPSRVSVPSADGGKITSSHYVSTLS